MRISVGVFALLFLLACSSEELWKVTASYPTGEVKIEKAYEVIEADTVFIYQKVYYQDGTLQLEGALRKDRRNGLWISYYQDGSKWSETTFADGVIQGETRSWFTNGNLRYEGSYDKGKRSGDWKLYDSTGTLVKTPNLDEK